MATARKSKIIDTNTVVIYCRVSTDQQEKSGLGLEAQLNLCRQIAQQLDLEIIGEFEETISGKIDPIFIVLSFIIYNSRKGKVKEQRGVRSRFLDSNSNNLEIREVRPQKWEAYFRKRYVCIAFREVLNHHVTKRIGAADDGI